MLCYAANGAADELALVMLGHVLAELPIVIVMTKTRLLASELVALAHAQGVSVVSSPICPPALRPRHATW